jgi:sec-independent protein translocase protein TatA
MWDAPWHWVVLAIVVIALLGYKKLPDAARSVGRSLRIFKTEIKGLTDDDKARAKAEEAEAVAPKALPAAEPIRVADAIKPAVPAADPVNAAPPRSRPRPAPSPNGRPAAAPSDSSRTGA